MCDPILSGPSPLEWSPCKKKRKQAKGFLHRINSWSPKCEGPFTGITLMSISRYLDVPVKEVPVHCAQCQFTAHGTVANLPGRWQKIKMYEKLQQRVVRMVDNEPRSTSKQIQADLQTQGTTVSAHTIRRHLNDKSLPKTYLRKPKSFWENVMWTDETKVELFGKAHYYIVYRKWNEAFKGKNTVPTVKHDGGSRCFAVPLLLLAPDALTVCMASWNLRTTLPTWSLLQKAHRNGLRQSVGEFWSDQQSRSKSNRHLWRDLKTAVGRRHPSNLRHLEQLAKKQWSKIPVERCKKLMVTGSDWSQVFFPKGVLPNIKFRVPIILASPFLEFCVESYQIWLFFSLIRLCFSNANTINKHVNCKTFVIATFFLEKWCIIRRTHEHEEFPSTVEYR